MVPAHLCECDNRNLSVGVLAEKLYDNTAVAIVFRQSFHADPPSFLCKNYGNMKEKIINYINA